MASRLAFDPGTPLPTGRVVNCVLGLDSLPRFVEIELREPDFIKFRALARKGRLAASVREATQGDLQRSLRYREFSRPSGCGEQVRVVFSDATGTWGALTVLRETRGSWFDDSEVGFLASLGPLLAHRLRRAAFLAEVATGDQRATAVVVLGADNSVEMATPGAELWLEDLTAGDMTGPELPVAVLGVAARARRVARNYQNDLDWRNPWSDMFARACVRGTDGRWVIVRGSALGEDPHCSVTLLLQQAPPPNLASLIAEAYGLADRERRVTEVVARSLPTPDIG